MLSLFFIGSFLFSFHYFFEMIAHVSLSFFKITHFWMRFVCIWKHKLAIRCFYCLSYRHPMFRIHLHLVSGRRKKMVEVTIKVFSKMFTRPVLATSCWRRHLYGSSLTSRPFHGHWFYIFSEQMRWKNNLHCVLDMLHNWCCGTSIFRTIDLDDLHDTFW